MDPVSQVFCHTNAQWRVDILTKGRETYKTHLAVQGNGFRLSVARFKQNPRDAQPACLFLESQEYPAAYSLAACIWFDIHSLDFGRISTDSTDSSTTERLPVCIGNEECSSPLFDLLCIKSKVICTFLRIAPRQFHIERGDQLCRDL
jgi:hypothetical protein